MLKAIQFRGEKADKLLKEFDNQKLLNHENIVKVYGWTKNKLIDDKICYGIVMEHLDFGDLETGLMIIFLIFLSFSYPLFTISCSNFRQGIEIFRKSDNSLGTTGGTCVELYAYFLGSNQNASP